MREPRVGAQVDLGRGGEQRLAAGHDAGRRDELLDQRGLRAVTELDDRARVERPSRRADGPADHDGLGHDDARGHADDGALVPGGEAELREPVVGGRARRVDEQAAGGVGVAGDQAGEGLDGDAGARARPRRPRWQARGPPRTTARAARPSPGADDAAGGAVAGAS